MFNLGTNTIHPLNILRHIWCSFGQFFLVCTMVHTSGNSHDNKVICWLVPCVLVALVTRWSPQLNFWWMGGGMHPTSCSLKDSKLLLEVIGSSLTSSYPKECLVKVHFLWSFSMSVMAIRTTTITHTTTHLEFCDLFYSLDYLWLEFSNQPIH